VGCHAKVRKKKEFQKDDTCLELAEPGDHLSEEAFKIKAIMIQNEP